MARKSRPPALPAGTRPDAAEDLAAGALGRRGISLATLALLGSGALALAGLLYFVGVADVTERLALLGWRAPAIVLPFALASLVDSAGWKRAIPRRSRARVSVARLFLMRQAGEAVSNLTPSAGLGGEPLKAFLLRRHGVPAADGVASVVIAKTAIICTQFVFTLLGLLLFVSWLGILRDRAPWLIAGGVAAAIASVVLVAGQRRGLAAGAVRLLARTGIAPSFARRLEGKAAEIDHALAAFYRQDPRGFAIVASLHMAGWFVGAGEVMFFFYLMDVECTWRQALIIESLAQATIAAIAVVPAGLGVQEITGAVLCRFLGIGEAAGTALMLLKRVREITFTVLGLSVISWLAKGKKA